MKSPPAGPAWVHEIKYDGYRMLCRIADGEARMMSRNAKDWTGDFPTSLARALAPPAGRDRPGSTARWSSLDARGRSSFQALQNALSGAIARRSQYFAFDLLYLDGFDLRGVALSERKRLLQELLSSAPATVKYSEHFAAPGQAFLDNVVQARARGDGLEAGRLAAIKRAAGSRGRNRNARGARKW